VVAVRNAGEQRRALPAITFLRVNDKGCREFRNEKDGSFLILVPAGEFKMGGSECEDEKPPHSQVLKEFLIGKCEVTNRQYAQFVSQTGYAARGEWRDYAVAGRQRHPVVSVTWADAVKYCEWAGLRLPTEAEWEKAARGTDDRRWPWGNVRNRNFCNNWDATRADLAALRAKIAEGRGSTPVGSFPEGASPYGALDCAGNVWEWCSSLYREYPYRAEDGREDPAAPGDRVLRGGSWMFGPPGLHRCAARSHVSPTFRNGVVGFRVAASP